MNKKGLFLVFTTAVISGFSIFINKYSVSVINPYIFTFLKNVIVALMLSGLVLAVKERKALKNLTKKQWLLLISIGLIGGSIPFLLFFKGLSMTTAAQGAFIHKTMFLYAAVLAVIFLKEKISRRFLIGVLLLLLGSLLTLKKLPTSVGVGDGLIFLATVLWAIENIISKYTLRELPAKIVAWGRMFFGSFFILVYLGLSGQLSLLSGVTTSQIGWVVITAALLFGYVMTWYSGLKHIPVSVATAVLVLGSSVTTILSLITGSSFYIRELFSAGLILFGLVSIMGIGQFLQLFKRRENYVRA